MKKFWRSTAMTGVMFALAVMLLFAGIVGGTQAALQTPSDSFVSAFNMRHIGVTLLENEKEVAWRNYGQNAGSGFSDTSAVGNLVLNDLDGDAELKLGKQYPFEISVQNSGTIDQYVRVTIRKYWVKNATGSGDKGYFTDQGEKIIDDIYKPDYIELSYNGSAYNNGRWIVDPNAHTVERDVYYYNGILSPGQKSDLLFDHLAISNNVTTASAKTVDGNKTIYTYAYDGYGFVIEAEVDAVQTHNKDAAIASAWGLNSIISQLPDAA